jgi:hypothetical protein
MILRRERERVLTEVSFDSLGGTSKVSTKGQGIKDISNKKVRLQTRLQDFRFSDRGILWKEEF